MTALCYLSGLGAKMNERLSATKTLQSRSNLFQSFSLLNIGFARRPKADRQQAFEAILCVAEHGMHMTIRISVPLVTAVLLIGLLLVGCNSKTENERPADEVI